MVDVRRPDLVGGAEACLLGQPLLRDEPGDLLERVVALVPDEWLADEPGFGSGAEVRAAYVDHFLRRLEARPAWQP